jgi:hypothetical protein
MLAPAWQERPPAWDTQAEMNEPACPYLVRETIAFRESLDLSRPAPTTVVVNWYCGHPFHGIRLDLGDAQAAVEQHCAACSLPRPAAEEKRESPPVRRSVRAR